MAENESNEISDENCIRSRLSKLTECPVCYEVMNTTVMCVNGHTVCKRCREQLSNCPLCNKSFGNVRNLLGEEVAELLNCKRCINSSRGCSKFLQESECKRHEESCAFRLYKCKECKKDLCFMELKNHFREEHQNSIIEAFVTKELQIDDAVEGKMYFCLIEFNGELFWFWRKYNKRSVYFGLQYCGEKEKVSAYTYNFQLVSKSDETDMEFTGPVLADVKEDNRYTHSQDYVVLSKNFMGEGAKFQVSVAKT